MSKKLFLSVVFLLMTAGCSVELAKSLLVSVSPQDKNLAHYKVGNPYRVNGRWYHPKEEPDYKEVGIASWYGSEFHDRLTANGEIFDKNKVSAAHRTLPMPSIVRVTNLENRKFMLIRVNDRGPFAHERILDLSEKAAKKLGVYKKGTAKVRVEFDKKATAALFSKERKDRLKNVVQHIPKVEKAHERKDVEETGIFIQAGAFGVRNNAEKVSDKLKEIAAIHIEKVEFPDIVLHRVRLGPFKNTEEADSVLNKVIKSGFDNAIIVSD